MNGRKAKALRRAVYGDMSPRAREYRRDRKTGAIEADMLRRRYQDRKRER